MHRGTEPLLVEVFRLENHLFRLEHVLERGKWRHLGIFLGIFLTGSHFAKLGAFLARKRVDAQNKVLQRDFEGIELRGHSGISTRGDAEEYYGALTAGKNFAGGAGNIEACPGECGMGKDAHW